MNVLEHLREKQAAADEWAEMYDVQYQVMDAPTVEGRAAAGVRMAELLDSYADRMDRSGLVRVLGTRRTSEQLRAEAAEYRAGRNPRA
jgi:hypothetical protein